MWRGELWHRRGNGEAFVENATRIALYDAGGEVENLVSIAADLTSHKDAEKVLVWQSNHDALTKLPNRGLLQERLSATLRQVRRDGGSGALLLIDLDNFKDINDSWGHPMGPCLCFFGMARSSYTTGITSFSGHAIYRQEPNIGKRLSVTLWRAR
ncbi:MAG: GGDEF domain-containing protein [Gemmatimonadetes bacterium]|nr:GGDEF domain-containing protein [Gemmatimonadota bacterium]